MLIYCNEYMKLEVSWIPSGAGNIL